MRDADEELRAFELERTEALAARLWPLIDRPKPDLQALTAYLRLADYRAKIAGLYAPRRQQVEVAVRGRVEHRKIEALRERLRALLGEEKLLPVNFSASLEENFTPEEAEISFEAAAPEKSAIGYLK